MTLTALLLLNLMQSRRRWERQRFLAANQDPCANAVQLNDLAVWYLAAVNKRKMAPKWRQ